MRILIGDTPARTIGVDLLDLSPNDRSERAREARHLVLGLPHQLARPGVTLYVAPSLARWLRTNGADLPFTVAPFDGGTLLTRMINRVWLRLRARLDETDDVVTARSLPDLLAE